MTTDAQVKSIQAETNLCTGPKSVAGKAIVSQNATRHGFLSQRLFVGDEEPSEFQALVDDLNTSLSPIGTLEYALVEKIAVIMWRQRRLVRAESAALTLQREPVRIVKAMTAELHRGYGNEVLTEHLNPFDAEREEWCRAALAEFEALEIRDLPTLEANAPHLYGQLVEDAEGQDIAKFTAQLKGGIEGFLNELAQWCRKELKEADDRPHLHDVADLVRDRSLVLSGEALELFSRYQTTLDGHLYKAMRALRDTQEARIRTLEAKSLPPSDAVAQPVPADCRRMTIVAEAG